MSFKLANLHEQINELQVDLDAALAAQQRASATLASSPGSNEARDTARIASARVADLQGDLKLLRDALAFAEAEDKSDEAQAMRKEAVNKLRALANLVKARNKAADSIDKALVVLQKACAEWVDAGGAVTAAAQAFCKLSQPGNPNAFALIQFLGGDMINVAGNALACQFEEATRGINMNGHAILSFVRDYPHAPELVAKQATRSGARLLEKMEAIARREGLQT